MEENGQIYAMMAERAQEAAAKDDLRRYREESEKVKIKDIQAALERLEKERSK